MLSIIFVSSVMFACCKLFFYHHSVENVTGIDIFLVLHLPAAIQRTFNYHIQILSLFCVTS